YTISFVNDLAGVQIPVLVASSGLTGGTSPSVSVSSGPIGAANVDVSGSAGSYTVTFDGDLIGGNVPGLTGNRSGLTGGTSPAVVASTLSALANVSVTSGASNQVLDLAAAFVDPDTSSTLLRFHTSMGNVDVQLDDAAAPQTVANFLDYIKSG